MSLHGGGGFGSPWQTPPQPSLSELDGNLGELEPLGELSEVGFEPQIRARSNTWPLPRPDNYVDPPEDAGSKKNSNQHLPSAGGLPMPSPASIASAKKNSSRRNAWGNLSYADLITQAITSAPDNRLTLSQIYEWMVQNVPYFKDKGDSNSSAGWKNSIRHNLSLHNRFMRVQNEGTGKSSWWMINPDAKPGKSVRRRAASMETSKFEKRRGRVKKKVEAIRNGMPADTTPSPSSSISEGLDMFPDSPLHSSTGGFQLSPDFRQRASSNASSCGRLSPIPSLLGGEPDWGPADYGNDYNPNAPDYAPVAGADQLAGSLADNMNLQGSDPFLNSYVPTTLSNGAGGCSAGGRGGGCSPSGPPPPYLSPRFPLAFPAHCPRHPRQPCACLHHNLHNPHNEGLSVGAGVAGLSPSYPAGAGEAPAGDPFMPPPATPPPPRHAPRTHTDLALADLMHSRTSGGLLVTDEQAGCVGAPTTMMGQLMGALNNAAIMEDLNLNLESLEHGGFDCNVDEMTWWEARLTAVVPKDNADSDVERSTLQVIKHELSMDGTLDFNFPQQQQQHNTLAPPAAPAHPAPPPYMHTHTHAHTHPQHSPDNNTGLDDSIAQQRSSAYPVAPSWVH